MENDVARLLSRFVSERSEEAFAALVRRHLDLVYSAARRQVRDDATAQDVAQEVFILLARKAPTIRSAAALPAWLLVTTRSRALNALRSESRRRKHEQETASMKTDKRAQTQGSWEVVAPLLDEAVARLNSADREAIALRYFQGHSVSEVAADLHVSPEAAQKRLSRAVDRLRRWFASRGIEASQAGLGSLLTANAVVAAPAVLREGLPAIVLVKAAAGSGVITSKGVAALMTIAKTNMVAAAAAAILVLGITGTVVYQKHKSTASQTSPPQAIDAAVPVVAPNDPGWQRRFNAVYALKDREDARFVPAPFIPERATWYQKELDRMKAYGASGPPEDPTQIRFSWDGKSFQGLSNWGEGWRSGTVRQALSALTGISSDLGIPKEILALPMDGDWVIREGMSGQSLIPIFEQQLAKATKIRARLTQKEMERDAIVATGTFKFTQVPGVERLHRFEPLASDAVIVELFYKHVDAPNEGPPSPTSCDLGELLNTIFYKLDRRIFVEGRTDVKLKLFLRQHRDFIEPESPPDDQFVDEVLANVARQTGLTFRHERRVLPTWVLSKEDAVAAALSTQSTAPAAGWEERFNAVYSLQDGENAKLIRPPFIPERAVWFNEKHKTRRPPPEQMVLWKDGDRLRSGYGGPGADTVRYGLWVTINTVHDLGIPEEILNLPMKGDWLIRQGASQDERIAALEKELFTSTGIRARLTQQQRECEIIVASGRFKFAQQPAADIKRPPAGRDTMIVEIFRKDLDKTSNWSPVTGSLEQFLESLSWVVNLRILTDGVDEPNQRLSWHRHTDLRHPPDETKAARAQFIDEVLANISRQTGLTFKHERRKMPTWVLLQGDAIAAKPAANPSLQVPAAAKPSTNPSSQPASANPMGVLPDGISVELLGVKLNTDIHAWWRADGSPLDPGPYDKKVSTPGGKHFIEMPVRVVGIKTHEARYTALGATLWRIGGGGIDGGVILAGDFPLDQEKTDLKISFGKLNAALALQPDPDPAKRGAQRVSKDVPGVGTIALANPREEDGHAVITATVPKPRPDLQVSVYAQGNKKVVRAIDSRSALRGTDVKDRDFIFDSPLPDVREFRIETRDFSAFVEFRNVSLKPGVKTDVKVITSEADATTTQPTLPATTQSATQPAAGWEERFNAVYALQDGEAAKLVRPPYIPERLTWYQKEHLEPIRRAGGAGRPDEPKQLLLGWDGKRFAGMPSWPESTVRQALWASTGISLDVGIPEETLDLPMPGDWVIRPGTEAQARIPVFEQELTRVTGIRAKLMQKDMKRDVIVATGTFKFTPEPGADLLHHSPAMGKDPIIVEIFRKQLNSPNDGGPSPAPGNLRELLDKVSGPLHQRIILDKDQAGQQLSWRVHRDYLLRPRTEAPLPPAQFVDEVLANISRQTGLSFKHERRVLPTWVLVKDNAATQPAPVGLMPPASMTQ